MTIPLSKRTVRLADALFDEPLLAQLKETLVTSVGDTLPFCKNQTPEGVERIRFAVLKLVKNGGNVADLINLAQTDWRDLLMAAGFGHALHEHLTWYQQQDKP